MIALLLFLASAPADPVLAEARPQPPQQTQARERSWLLPAGLAFASAGALALASGAFVGALAFATQAQASAAAVQLDAVALDGAAREQARLANALALFGAVVVVGGAATAGAGLLLE